MVARSLVPRLTDIVEAIERINGVLENISLQAFETDWQRQWLVERGIEIISEAIDRRIASYELRRMAAMRALEHYSEALARRAKAASDVIEGELTEAAE